MAIQIPPEIQNPLMALIMAVISYLLGRKVGQSK